MRTFSLRPLWLMFLFLAGTALHGQGDLTPPGGPAPTQKSLQEIWDKVGALETQVTTVETQNTILQSQNTLLQRQLGLLVSSTVNFAWVPTTVADGGGPSLAFGPDGLPAIAFSLGYGLKLARFDGTFWTLSDIAEGAEGDYPSLAFGPDGFPAVAYRGRSGSPLHFAQFDGSAWSVTIVDSDPIVDGAPSLGFGSDGLPAIAYIKSFGNGRTLAFTGYSGGEWSQSALIEAGSYLDNSVSLGIGSDGQPMISFRMLTSNVSSTNGTVKVARQRQLGRSPNTILYWAVETVANDQTPATYMNTPIAIGPDGQPAVAYADNKNQRLYVARYNGSAWKPGLVSLGRYTATMSLAFGPDGQPVLIHTDGRELLFSRYVGNLEGPAWSTTPVDSAGEIGIYCSLAFGPGGQPAIAYMDYTASPSTIKFAHKGTFKTGP